MNANLSPSELRVWTISACPECGAIETASDSPEMGGHMTVHTSVCSGPDAAEVKVVALADVVRVLEAGYAPQNPTAHHPADWIEQHFGFDTLAGPSGLERRARPTPSTDAQDSAGERAGSSHSRSSHDRCKWCGGDGWVVIDVDVRAPCVQCERGRSIR